MGCVDVIIAFSHEPLLLVLHCSGTHSYIEATSDIDSILSQNVLSVGECMYIHPYLCPGG